MMIVFQPTLKLIGNRGFDDANGLSLAPALGRKRADQPAVWPQIAGGPS